MAIDCCNKKVEHNIISAVKLYNLFWLNIRIWQKELSLNRPFRYWFVYLINLYDTGKMYLIILIYLFVLAYLVRNV